MVYFAICFLIFTLIGFGPSLYIVQKRYTDALLIAPTIGLGILAIVIVNLVYISDIALKGYGLPILGILLAISGGLTIFYFIKHPRVLSQVILSRMTLFLIIATIIIGGLLALPAMVGGKSYQFWQGNMYDWMNYTLMAFYRLNFDSASFANPAQFQDIASVAKGLYTIGRPGVSYILAWFADLYRIPIYDLMYAYVLSLLLPIFTMGMAVGRLINLSFRTRVIMGMVLTVGFWTFLVSDINAISQVSSISPLVFFIYAWLLFESKSNHRFISHPRLVFAFSIAILFTLYPEILPVLFSTIGLYYVILWLNRFQIEPLKHGLLQLITIGFGLLIAFPTVPHTFSYLLGQISVGTDADVIERWQYTFFSWLYTNNETIPNLWGLHPYLSASALAENRFALAFSFMAFTVIPIALLSILLTGIARALMYPSANPKATLLISGIVTYWGLGVSLQLMNLQWTGVKLLIMGAPFVVIALFLFNKHFNQYRRQLPKRGSNMAQLVTLAISVSFGIWGISQIAMPFIRTYYSTQQLNILYYPDLRQAIYDDIAPIIEFVAQEPNTVIYTSMSRDRERGDLLWQMMFDTNNRDHVGFDGMYYNLSSYIGIRRWEKSDVLPNYWAVVPNADLFYQSGVGQIIIDKPLFRLYQVSPQDLDRVNFNTSLLGLNPAQLIPADRMSGLFLNDDGVVMRWLMQEARIRFIASGDTPFVLYLAGTPMYDGTLQFRLDDTETDLDAVLVTHDTPLEYAFCFTPTPATNNMTIASVGELDDPDQAFLLQNWLLIPASTRLDVGDRVADSRLIISGWESEEQWGDENVRWANETAQLMLLSCDDAPTTLRFRAFYSPDLNANPQQVTISVNGVEHPSITLSEGWQEYELPLLDGAFLPNQPQIITLDHAWATIPSGDTRTLSATYDWFEITSD